MSDFSIANNYCYMHDVDCQTEEEFKTHLLESLDHPRCETCECCFLDEGDLITHYSSSDEHYYCALCDRHFPDAVDLRRHNAQDPDDESEDSDAERDEPVSLQRETSELWAADNESFYERSSEHEWWASDDECYLGELERKMTFAANEDLDYDSDDEEEVANGKVVHVLQYTCPICLVTPHTVSATRCGHLFCHSCITRVFDELRPCPICRSTGTLNQLRTIYLSTPN